MATTLNIKINPQIDKAELQAQLTKLGNMQFDAEIDTEQIDNALDVIMNNYQRLENAMSDAINLDVNAENADKVINDLYDAIDKIQNEDVNINLDSLAAEFKKAKAETEKLLDTQKSALAQMKLTGQSGSDSYKELESQIGETKSALEAMTEAANSVGDGIAEQSGGMMEVMAKFEAVSQFADSMGQFAEKGLAVRDAMVEVAAQTGASAEEMNNLKTSAENAFRLGVGESVADAIEAMGTAKQMLGQFLPQAEIEKFVLSAQGIAKVFDKDINEVIAGSRTFIAQFGLDGQKAGDLIALSMQKGGGKMDDVLDTLDEYSQLVKSAGFSAEEFTGIMTTGMQAGVRDTDKLADAIKETQIRLNAGDTTTALAAIKSPITATIQGIQQLASSGQISIKEMLQRSTSEIEKAFSNKQISASLRDQFNTALSGTMAEDIGGMNFGKIFSQQIDVDAISAQAKAAGEAVRNAAGNATVFDSLQREFDLLITKTSELAGPIAGAMSGILTPIAQVAPGITLLKDTFGGVAESAISAAKGILGKLVPGLFVQVAATEGATVAQYSFNAAALLNPYIIGAAVLAAAVVGIIALADALSDSTEEQLDANKANQEAIQSQMDANKSKQEAVKSNQDLIKSYEELGSKTNRTAQEEERFRDIQLKLAEAYPGTIKANDDFNTSLGKLKNKAGENKAELGKLANELESFQNKANGLQLQEKTLNIRVAQEEIEDNTDNGLQDQIVAKYANAMNNAKNSAEVKKASYDMKMALVNSDGWDDMDAAQRKAVMAGVDKMAQAATEKADIAAKQSTDIMNNAINNIATNEGYNTTVEAVAKKSKKSVQEVQDAMISNLAVQSAKGKDTNTMYEKIAQTLHKSPEEVKQMVAAQKDSVAVAKAQSEAIADIAKKWTDAKSAAESNISTQKSVYLQTEKEINQMKQKKNLTEAEKQKLGELQKTKAATLASLRDEVKTKKQMEKAEEAADYASGLKVAKGKTALEIAQAEFKIKSASLENDNKIYQNTIKNQAAQEKRKLTTEEEKKIEDNNLLTLQNQRDAYEEIYKKRRLINGVAIDGTVEFDVKLKNKEDAKNTIQSEILGLSDKVLTAKATIEPKIDLSKLGTELSDAQFALDKKKLEVRIEQKISTVDLGDITKLYSSQFDGIAKKRDELTAKLASATEAEKLDIQKQLIELEQKEIALNEEKLAMNKKYSDKRIALLQEENEKNIADTAAKQAIARQAFETVYNTMGEVAAANIEASKSSRLDALDKQMNAEIARVGDNERAKEIITRKFNDLKAQAEREYASQQMVLAANLAGERRAFEDEIAKQDLQKKQEQLQKELELAKQSGDSEKALELEKQMAATAKEIEGKGDILKEAMNNLGLGANEALASALGGDISGVKKALKKNMADLGGYLKRLATAKIIEIVLQSPFYTNLAALAGPFAPAVEAGAIGLLTTGMNALLNPVINTLTSFPTGAGYINEPTMFIAGDGGRLGGENKEVLLRDDQFQATLSDVLERQRNEMANMIASAMGANQQTLITKISATDLLILLERAKSEENSRIRTNKS